MKANELRIGNWVYNPLQQIPFKVDFTALSNVYYDNKLDKPRYEPIPLTEEILLKCGFSYSSIYKSYFKQTNKGEFIIRGNDFVLCDIDIRVEVKHLHELQNLYFALIGEELNIEL